MSDPIIFGHAVKAYLQPVFDRFGDVLQAAAINPNSGIGAMIEDIQSLPEKDQIEAAIADVLADRPPLYMVNSDKGISNLHVPSDVIIDASMPALIRAGGKGWGPDGAEADANCVIPDSSYAAVYEEAVEDCKKNGAFRSNARGHCTKCWPYGAKS